jgi:hypothetical protein
LRVKKTSEDTLGGGEFGKTAKRGVASQGAASGAFSFSTSLEDAEIRELLQRLELLGKQMSVFPAESMLLQYRQLVAELLRRAVNSLRVRRDMKWRRGDRNFFVIVEKTESMLDALDDVFQREGERTKMLQIMEEIKGCLISLLL